MLEDASIALKSCVRDAPSKQEGAFDVCADADGFVVRCERARDSDDGDFVAPPDPLANCVQAEMLAIQLPLNAAPATGAACLELRLYWD
jgi:hypothetical protein